jgi:excisionase family DNA binding protein
MNNRDLLNTVLNPKEAELAKTAQRCLIAALDHSKAVNIAIIEDGVEQLGDGAPLLRLPPKVLRLFADMLGAMAQGQPVAVLPQSMEVTTQQAAHFLNVSRPYLIKLLTENKIPYHKLGKHRRILLEDILKYKSERRDASLKSLQELTDQAQDLDMGY